MIIWYDFYFWLFKQGVHPTIKGEVWEFLLGCYDPKSTTEQRNQLRQQRRFYAIAFLNHACFFSCLKDVSFDCSTSFCITKERQILFLFWVKNELWQMLLCNMAHCFVLQDVQTIALSSSLIIKVYLCLSIKIFKSVYIICYVIRNILIYIFW